MRLISDKDVKDLLLGLDALPWEEQVDELVDRIPTAYDVDAMVRELERIARIHARQQIECENKQWNYLADQHKYYVRAFDEAIAIVKRGGRNE